MNRNMKFNKEEFLRSVKEATKMKYAKSFDEAFGYEKFNAVSMTLMNMLADDWKKTTKTYKEEKQACYLSAEFLMGRALGNNLLSLGLYSEVKEALDEYVIGQERAKKI